LKFEKIHEDNRGEIYLVLDALREGRELTLFTTRNGYARGGCIHRKSGESCVVIKGEIKYWIGDNTPIIMSRGDTCYIEAGVPHYFVALTDETVVMEWGALPEEKKEKYPSSRFIVDIINKRRSGIR